MGDKIPGESAPESIDLRDLSLEDLRLKRRKAETDEQDLSYVRRLLHGRIDIIKAEIARRSGEGDELIANLKTILSDSPGGARKSQGRYMGIEDADLSHPAAQDAHQALGGLSTTNLSAVSDEELETALASLKAHERIVSDVRLQLHKQIDSMGSALTRRYREGTAQVDDLLAAARRP